MKKINLIILVFGLILFLTSVAFANMPEEKFREIVAMGSASLVIGVTFTIIFFTALSFQIILSIFFAETINNSIKLMNYHSYKLSFLGFLNTVGMIVLIGILVSLNNPLTHLIAILVMLVFLAILLLSITSSSSQLGRKILEGTVLENHKVIPLMAGWFTLAFCIFIPILGWLIFLYYTLSGIGSTMLAFFQEKENAEDKNITPPQNGIVIEHSPFSLKTNEEKL